LVQQPGRRAIRCRPPLEHDENDKERCEHERQGRNAQAAHHGYRKRDVQPAKQHEKQRIEDRQQNEAVRKIRIDPEQDGAHGNDAEEPSQRFRHVAQERGPERRGQYHIGDRARDEGPVASPEHRKQNALYQDGEEAVGKVGIDSEPEAGIQHLIDMKQIAAIPQHPQIE
jgi:hypothetical protein